MKTQEPFLCRADKILVHYLPGGGFIHILNIFHPKPFEHFPPQTLGKMSNWFDEHMGVEPKIVGLPPPPPNHQLCTIYRVGFPWNVQAIHFQQGFYWFNKTYWKPYILGRGLNKKNTFLGSTNPPIFQMAGGGVFGGDRFGEWWKFSHSLGLDTENELKIVYRYV